MFHQAVAWLTQTVGQWGYPGIVALMFLESSFFPFPSEVVIPPAAYLAAGGKMHIGMVIFCGTLGSLLGSVFNYWLALAYGRPFFEKWGRYLLVSRRSMERADVFFDRHGHISTFIGRLLPGIRQYISLPAGLARMNFPVFCGATTLGACLWVSVLAAMGFWFGRNEALVEKNLHWISLGLFGLCLVLGVGYWITWGKRTVRAASSVPGKEPGSDDQKEQGHP
jgi:membrane protein DedA with SNARE-associated domain